MRNIVRISEIFYSIQGEGKNLGKKYVFVRFAGCNFACSWCDTKYSWHKDHLVFRSMPFDELVMKIRTFSKENCCKRILFTGGEPLLFQEAIGEIMKRFKNYFFEVETNGSIGTILPFDQINVGYKLKNSGISSYDLKIRPAINVHYKFVIRDERDTAEALNFCESREIPLDTVYFMPEGVLPSILRERGRWLERKCAALNVHFSPREHIMRFGNRRGV